MYIPGTIIYFSPFYFKNGNPCKEKYLVVLYNEADKTIYASLPTRTDSVPSYAEIKHGCIDIPEAKFNCYHIEKNRVITDTGFYFPCPTFLYGYHVDEYNKALLNETYSIEEKDYRILGCLIGEEFKNIISCFVNSDAVKGRYRKVLRNILN